MHEPIAGQQSLPLPGAGQAVVKRFAMRAGDCAAGFGDKDLSVDVKDGVLTVTGKREDAQKAAYLHHGIAGRAFERSFQLAEHVEVRGARLENGLLHVDLERVVPEEKKPRKIQINAAPELKSIETAKAA